MHGTHGDLARGHGHLSEAWGHISEKPLKRGGSNRGPHQSLDEGGIGGVKGLPIGVGLPFLQQECQLPDIMPPQVEAFTKYISRPRHRYATCSLWRCPRCLAYVSPLPASRAGALAYPCPIASRYHIPLTIGACQYREKIPS